MPRIEGRPDQDGQKAVSRLAIIPARGGSKRIPNKNIRDFCGRPMIAHILESAKASELFETVHVSTDSPGIAQAAAASGFPPDFMRPAALADDHTPILPVLRHVAEEYGRRGRNFDEIWVLLACAPLVSAADLGGAAKLFAEAGRQSPVLAVSAFPVPVEWAYDRRPDGMLVPTQPGMFAVRSQDLATRYYDTGSFAAFPAADVLAVDGAGSDENFLGYVLPKGAAIDIDDEEDWQLAEAIYRARSHARR